MVFASIRPSLRLEAATHTHTHTQPRMCTHTRTRVRTHTRSRTHMQQMEVCLLWRWMNFLNMWTTDGRLESGGSEVERTRKRKRS